jgi:hypothetical protein
MPGMEHWRPSANWNWQRLEEDEFCLGTVIGKVWSRNTSVSIHYNVLISDISDLISGCSDPSGGFGAGWRFGSGAGGGERIGKNPGSTPSSRWWGARRDSSVDVGLSNNRHDRRVLGRAILCSACLGRVSLLAQNKAASVACGF